MSRQRAAAADHATGAGHGSVRSYTLGFLLSLVLTGVPFFIVMTSALPRPAAIVALVTFAVGQILVHLVFFLHLGTSSAQRWNLVALAYTLVILVILVGASIWIMYHLDYNMMDTSTIVP